jgi:hypothetical protein
MQQIWKTGCTIGLCARLGRQVRQIPKTSGAVDSTRVWSQTGQTNSCGKVVQYSHLTGVALPNCRFAMTSRPQPTQMPRVHSGNQSGGAELVATMQLSHKSRNLSRRQALKLSPQIRQTCSFGRQTGVAARAVDGGCICSVLVACADCLVTRERDSRNCVRRILFSGRCGGVAIHRQPWTCDSQSANWSGSSSSAVRQ